MLQRDDRRQRLIARRLVAEDGSTLMEMLVAASVGVAVLAVVFALMDMSFKSSASTVDRTEAVQRGRAAMNEITRTIREQTCGPRGEAPLVAATATSLTFYAQVTRATIRMRQVELLDGAISQRTWSVANTLTSVSATPPGGATVRLLAGKSGGGAAEKEDVLLLQDGTPIFRYYNAAGTQLAVPLSAANLAQTVRVDVAYRALQNTTNGTPRETRFSNRITVRAADADNLRGNTPCA